MELMFLETKILSAILSICMYIFIVEAHHLEGVLDKKYLNNNPAVFLYLIPSILILILIIFFEYIVWLYLIMFIYLKYKPKNSRS